MSNKAIQTSITGRDALIVNKAMLYAIASIQSLPEDRQEWSDMRDMCQIVRANASPFTMAQVLDVEAHTDTRPDLWPNPWGADDDEGLSHEDREQRDQFNAACDAIKTEKNRYVEFLKDGSSPTADPDFVEMTPDDETHIRSTAA